MKIIESEQLIPVDIDDTLLLWNSPQRLGSKDCVEFINPYTGKSQWVPIHTPHILVIKQRLERGATVILWSASGWRWAKAAAECLGIDGDNLIVASKPIFYMDDKPSTFWLKEPMFMDPDDKWSR